MRTHIIELCGRTKPKRKRAWQDFALSTLLLLSTGFSGCDDEKEESVDAGDDIMISTDQPSDTADNPDAGADIPATARLGDGLQQQLGLGRAERGLVGSVRKRGSPQTPD